MASSLYYQTFNPANIRYSDSNRWQGQIGNVNGFVQFSDVLYGVRALVHLLRNYINRGYDTVGGIIARFAPPKENDTQKYIEFVLDFLGDYGCFESNIRFKTYAFKLLCKAICRYESSYNLTDLEYEYVIERYFH